ncbi:hypothetical protein FB451DRAFT_1197196 [Mycena latifolia]|nr:hypothetical protein FB451DRAFT_1197196 [Mycena latifolia]
MNQAKNRHQKQSQEDTQYMVPKEPDWRLEEAMMLAILGRASPHSTLRHAGGVRVSAHRVPPKFGVGWSYISALFPSYCSPPFPASPIFCFVSTVLALPAVLSRKELCTILTYHTSGPASDERIACTVLHGVDPTENVSDVVHRTWPAAPILLYPVEAGQDV